MTDTPLRRAGRRLSLGLCVIGLAVSAFIFLHGGFDLFLSGLRITAHDMSKPLLLALIGLVGYRLSGGRILTDLVRSGVLAFDAFRVPPRATAVFLALVLSAVGFVYASKACGGS